MAKKWISIITITFLLNLAESEENDCNIVMSYLRGQQITCTNVSSTFFETFNHPLHQSHWLTCKYCDLNIITKDTFNLGKNNISYLSLQDNNIVNLSNFAFYKLPLLKMLNLTGNSITFIDYRAFYGIKKLYQLELAANQMETLDNFIFVELENLDLLNLNGNAISLIHLNAFMGLKNLKYLYLNYNRLKHLDANVFKHLENVKILYLENNEIVEIHPQAFNNLKNLNYLYLSNNSISYLVQYNFKPLAGLLDLQLRFNNLTEIQTSTFNGLKNIKSLYLGQNYLKVVRPYGLIGLNSLEILDFIGNKFTSFSLDYFKDMDKLHALWLENNLISEFFVQNNSDTLNSLKTLDLLGNKLKFLDYKLLYEKVPNLQEVVVGDNEWTCKAIVEMYDYFVNSNNNIVLCSNTECNVNKTEDYIRDICSSSADQEEETGDFTTDFTVDSAAFRYGLNSFTICVILLRLCC